MKIKPAGIAFFPLLLLATSWLQAATEWQQTQTFTAPDGAATDQLGFSVAISGNLALAGANQRDVLANGNQGAASLFDPTTGVQTRLLTAADGAADDGFGWSVALSGSIAIVGAPFDDVAEIGARPIDAAGSAHLYHVDTGEEIASLSINDGNTMGDCFGWAVAVDGPVALVGAPFGAVNEVDRVGRTSVHDSATGELLGTLTASDGLGADYFGWAVGVSGSHAVVGAPYADVDGIQQAGKAYILDVTTGEELFKLTASDAGTEENFGIAVAIGGNFVVVGASNDQVNSLTIGSAYVFNRTTGAQLFKLTASDAANVARFGGAIAISGNFALIGASGMAGSTGAAYLFDLTTGQQVQKLTAADGVSGDAFGIGVGISGTQAVIGAHQKDVEANSAQGRAYVFSEVTLPAVAPAPDRIRPTLKVTSRSAKRPRKDARVVNVKIGVTAEDNVQVSRLHCGGGGKSVSKRFSTPGRKKWTFNLKVKKPRRGSKIRFTIRAYDSSNNVSLPRKVTTSFR